VILHGILASALLHHLFQTSGSLQVLILGHQLLPFGFATFQEKWLLALFHSFTLFSLQTNSQLFLNKAGVMRDKDCGIHWSGSLSSNGYLSLIDRMGRQHKVLSAAQQPKTLLPVFNSI